MIQYEGKPDDSARKKLIKTLSEINRGVTPRELMRRSGVKSREQFYAALDELKSEGKLTVSKRTLVRLSEKEDLVSAKVMSLSRGFAFVRPEDGGDDLYVHGDNLQGAIVGDTVLLKNISVTPRGKKAEVSSVTERRDRFTTGTVLKTEFGYELIPDIAIRYHLPIDKKDLLRARDGDKVQASMYRLPHRESLGAKVVKIYGRAESARICADAIVDQNGIPSVFPEEVLTEAAHVAGLAVTRDEKNGRLDLRNRPICTIDSADAKDLDDAFYAVHTEDGFELGVHIADVSHYVREGSAIDDEAQLRGTSVYFADRVIPMLPKELSNGVCSLNAGEDKLTFSAIIRLDRTGEIVSYQFRKSVIDSKVRGVYSEVNQIFSGEASEELLKKYEPVVESLRTGKELADILRRKSRENGTMELESGESEFTLDENGVCIDVKPRVQGDAEKMIEQLMIAANQAAARLAREAHIPFVYRVHGNPDPDRVENLANLAGALGLQTKMLKGKTPAPGDFAALLEQAKGTPSEKVISHQILRTMDKARYSTEPLGHFGLALADYCHFTSPIRRYPDLAIHRILTAALEEKQPLDQITLHYAPYAASAAADSSKFEVRAMTAERSAEDCYMAEYMRAHIGEEFDGVVSGVTMRGVFVELASSAEGFVPVISFPGANYQFDGVVSQVDETTGKRLTIGQPLRVVVVSADVPSGRIDFAPAGVSANNSAK